MKDDQKSTLWSRKDFLKLSSMGIASLALPLWLGGCEELDAAIRNRPMRRYIRTGSPELDIDMNIYKNGVSIMKTKPASDPLSWVFQKNIHANFCSNAHGKWFFFPWHRAYLFYLEDIIRKVTNQPRFALPYWNWSLDGRKIPAQFWGGASNPLWHSTRSATATSINSNSNVGTVTLTNIMNQTTFPLFGGTAGSAGSVEATPHNNTHGFVGGSMGSVPTAANDPIFYAHHCMVDYMWAVWNINCGNSNPALVTWKENIFSGMFYNGNSQPVSIKAGDTVILPMLMYQYELSSPYDTLCPNHFQRFEKKTDKDFIAFRKAIEDGAEINLKYKMQTSLSRGFDLKNSRKEILSNFKIEQGFLDMAFNSQGEEKVILSLDNIKSPVENNFYIRIFINMPEADKNTPTEDIHFAGSFAFFPDPEKKDSHNHPHSLNYLVELTQTMRNLKKQGKEIDAKNFSLNFVAVPSNEEIKSEDFTFGVEEIKLGVAEISVIKK